MFFLLDNYDSFVYNLSAYFQELGQDVLVRRPDAVTISEILAINPTGIILSPGPGHPEEASFSLEVIRRFKGQIPILGVCLGHQTIAYYFGASVNRGERPMHGKTTEIVHKDCRLFSGLPPSFKATRYHSLVVDPVAASRQFEIVAVSDHDTVMSISHKELPLYGVQFHPEALLTEFGHQLLANFIQICQYWEKNKRLMV